MHLTYFTDFIAIPSPISTLTPHLLTFDKRNAFKSEPTEGMPFVDHSCLHSTRKRLICVTSEVALTGPQWHGWALIGTDRKANWPVTRANWWQDQTSDSANLVTPNSPALAFDSSLSIWGNEKKKNCTKSIFQCLKSHSSLTSKA